MPEQTDRHLAWFLGPKAENAQLLEDTLIAVLRDYVYWRRNYFPGDNGLLDRHAQRSLEDEYDAFTQNVAEMMAELRRSFPFYSPRYIAHEQSDTTLPSLVGYIAALLHNPNNVTPEGAPVTVDWEIDACNEILKMLGYTPPPPPPRTEADVGAYERRLRAQFGWAHLTLGGTTANIEALWVARTVRYLALAIRSVAIQEGLSIEVQSTSGPATPRDIRDLSERDTLLLRPQQAVSLLAAFVEAVQHAHNIPVAEAGARATTLLGASDQSLGKGVGALFYHHPPVIFASGAAHYSVRKAADVLGLGRDNVVLIGMDAQFRLDVGDLETKMVAAVDAGKVPLAVIGIAGTTEEGAVDPIHRIADLRERLERERGISFWLHLDAAWCGYLRTLFRDADAVLARLAGRIGLDCDSDLDEWHAAFRSRLLDTLRADDVSEVLRAQALNSLDRLDREARVCALDAYVDDLRVFLLDPGVHDSPLSHLVPGVTAADFAPSPDDHAALVGAYVRDQVEIHWGSYREVVPVSWGGGEVGAAFMAFPHADSITVDPHKMGYVPYPCGVVAFKDDRVRHFILQEAPYITSAGHNALLHMPPKHVENIADDPADSKVLIDAFAPFILEGSRPGAAASALRLAIKTVPLTLTRHGAIVRASLLAARELFEWLRHWDALPHSAAEAAYRAVPLTDSPPDTNTVIFVVKEAAQSSLAAMNRLTLAVYEHFTIKAELGEREYSYTQPFFLSKTTFRQPWYPYDTLRDFFARCRLPDAREEYARDGLVVLRATVMNPYIQSLRRLGAQNVAKEFMRELAIAMARPTGHSEPGGGGGPR